MLIPSKIAIAPIMLLLCMGGNCFGLRAQQSVDPSSEAIVLGLLVEDSVLVDARYGAEFAVKEINRKGGLKGKPIELSVRSMEGPWGVGSKQAVDLVFDRQAWALVGLLNGRNSHLVEQVAAKTNVPFISAWASDPTLSKAYVPQFFNCIPNSEQQGRVILNEVSDHRGFDKWILVSDDDYESRIAVESLLNIDEYMTNKASKKVELNSSEDFEDLTRALREKMPEALVVFCEPELSFDLIRFLRTSGIMIPVYSNLNLLHENTYSRVVSEEFEELYLCVDGPWMTDRESDFVLNFRDEFGRDPGAMAAYAYDAVQILAEAITLSGPDPKKLKQSLSKTSYSGKTGAVEFDSYGNRKSVPSSGVVSTRILSGSKP